MGASGAYLKLGTQRIGEAVSPDRRWTAVLMVRNGGAMTGYATVVSVTHANWLERGIVWLWPENVFIADDNHGALSSGDQGQVSVGLKWESSTHLEVSYPERARIFKQVVNRGPLTITYASRN